MALNNLCLNSPVKSGLIFFTLFFVALYGVVILFHLDALSSVLDNHWQTVDIAVLIHLYHQPPLFNFFFWLMAVIPGAANDHLVVLNCLAQTLVACIVFKISSSYLKSTFGGLVIGALYLMSPTVLLNSAYAFYPPLTSMGFALLVYAFFVIKDRPRFSAVLIGFSICYFYMIQNSFSFPAAFILLFIFSYISRKYPLKVFFGSTLVLSLAV